MMSEATLPDPKTLSDFIALLAPGLIILGIRQRFVAAPAPEFKERAIAYAGVSSVYYAVSSPAFNALSVAYPPYDWLTTWVKYVILPTVVGLIYAFCTYHEVGAKFWQRAGIQPVHLVLTAWDYAFKRLPPTCVAVTLNDGRIIYGIYGPGSFTSSISDERDILISNACEFSAGKWRHQLPPRSILLFGRDIRSIEFFRGTNGPRR